MENFNYPFSNRKLVRDEYYAQLPTNGTTKYVHTHKIFLQNSVVCLQSNWWKIFGFVNSGVSSIVKIIKKNLKLEEEGEPSVKYQCGNPFLKLKFQNAEVATKNLDLP